MRGSDECFTGKSTRKSLIRSVRRDENQNRENVFRVQKTVRTIRRPAVNEYAAIRPFECFRRRDNAPPADVHLAQPTRITQYSFIAFPSSKLQVSNLCVPNDSSFR